MCVVSLCNCYMCLVWYAYSRMSVFPIEGVIYDYLMCALTREWEFSTTEMHKSRILGKTV